MFDADHNYMVDFSEFNSIIQLMGSEAYMGAKKMQVLIDMLIFREEPFFQGGAKLPGETVDQETSKKLFESFNPIQTRQEKVVNFLVNPPSNNSGVLPVFLEFLFPIFSGRGEKTQKSV
jgi:hypothetical protein